MSALPSGTVTFLFTDIEGSTQLLQELGDRYAGALADHRRLLRDAFARHGGHEVDTQGDAFFVAFVRAQEAAGAARDAQRALADHAWPNGRGLRVRMGIHTCEASTTDEGYVGIGVHRAARICSSAHGGQVLLSHTTRDLLDEEELDLGLRDLGEHRLKDLTRPQRLFQLVGEGLPTSFPPLKTLENRPTNLPVHPTPLVGREQEVQEIGQLLRRDDVRLVTLTGPGGTGKTRLALQTAAELVDEFANGVFLVALGPITDPDLVVPAVAETLGINEAGGQSLGGYLAGKRILFVVDNLEQVLSAAPQLAQLLSDATLVKMIATSREPLRIAAEHVYPVTPLPESDAVALFIERAQTVQRDFGLTPDNASAITEICARLDGLPLAVELAAARISLLSPEAMLPRLGERLKLLTAGARDLPERQQTLRHTLQWSFDLLDEPEQRLFARQGVFVGGYTLDAAEAVCDAELDGLASLVDKSLVHRQGDRYVMLETVREFACERLAVSGEDLRSRHAAYYLHLAEEAYEARIEHESEAAERVAADHDNLRAAFDRLHEENPHEELRLAGALGWFWRVRSHMSEGRERLAAAIERATERDAHFARALASAGSLAAWQGDIEDARPALEEAIAFWRGAGNLLEEGLAYESLAWGLFFAGDDSSARAAAEASVEVLERHGDERLVNRAQLAVCQVLVSQEELEAAERLSRQALALAEARDDEWARHLSHHYLADCALIGEDYDTAEERYANGLRAALSLGDRTEIAVELQGIAMATAGRSQAERALRLAGAAEAELDALGVDISGVVFWTALLDKNLGPAHEALGAERAGAALAEGKLLGLERAADEALAPWEAA